MDKVNKQELRRLAEAARVSTNGDWVLYVPEDYQGPSELPGCGIEDSEGRAVVWGALEPETGFQHDEQAKFVAAANPAAILSLLDECDGLMAQHSRDSAELRALCQARDETRRERDQLRAELEQCRKDALRYRWLRDVLGTVPMTTMADEGGGKVGGWIWGEKLDAAIDAAMAKEGGANG